MTRKKGPLCLSYFVICIRCATIWIFRKLFCGYGNALKLHYKNDPIDRILPLVVSFTTYELHVSFRLCLNFDGCTTSIGVGLAFIFFFGFVLQPNVCDKRNNGILPLQGRTETCFSKTLYLLLYTYCYVLRTFLIVTDLYVRCIRSYVRNGHPF